MIQKPTLEQVRRLWANGYQYIAGVDEVGRGALAGPVMAAALVLNQNHKLVEGVADSKLLSFQKRNVLHGRLIEENLDWAIGQASVKEINDEGIVAATHMAMMRALDKLKHYDFVLIDGLSAPQGLNTPYQTIIKGDQSCYTIAAASIMAKVTRDAYMIDLSMQDDRYDWASNKGYGTSKHIEAIKRYGLSQWHRKQFVRKIW